MYQEIGFLDDLLLHIYNELCGFGDMVWFVCWIAHSMAQPLGT